MDVPPALLSLRKTIKSEADREVVLIHRLLPILPVTEKK
jgi:hypothetical protein